MRRAYDRTVGSEHADEVLTSIKNRINDLLGRAMALKPQDGEVRVHAPTKFYFVSRSSHLCFSTRPVSSYGKVCTFAQARKRTVPFGENLTASHLSS